MYNVKKEVTKKVTNPQSISKMLYILGIIADHIVISQMVTIKSQVNGFQMIRKNTKKNKNYVEIGFLIIFLNSYIDLVDLFISNQRATKMRRVSTINRMWVE